MTTHSQGPQVIATPNQMRSAPYPVQESVTVIPLAMPQPQPLPFQFPYATGGGQDPRHGNYVTSQPPPSYVQGENGMKNTAFDAAGKFSISF